MEESTNQKIIVLLKAVSEKAEKAEKAEKTEKTDKEISQNKKLEILDFKKGITCSLISGGVNYII